MIVDAAERANDSTQRIVLAVVLVPPGGGTDDGALVRFATYPHQARGGRSDDAKERAMAGTTRSDNCGDVRRSVRGGA